MLRILEDPSDDTKGFFDPNTKENLTYMGLMERCVEDPDTKLLMVPLKTENPAEKRKTFRLERRISRDDVTFQSGWRRPVKLTDLVNANLIEESKVTKLERQEVRDANFCINFHFQNKKFNIKCQTL